MAEDIKRRVKKKKKKKKLESSGITAEIVEVDPSEIIFNPKNPQKQSTKEFGAIVKLS